MMIELQIRTRAQTEFQEITAQVQRAVAESGAQDAICHIFVPHTTAGLTLNENWDPNVRDDLLHAMAEMVPDLPYRHSEGNSPAHLMATLVGSSETLLIDSGRLVLGSWQGLYLAEFDGPRLRKVLLRIVPGA
jgi:secondary thiamine-phosphate synthase enzyme